MAFFHYYLFWIALVLLVCIILSLSAKEAIDKTIRVVLGFSWIAIITPIVDLIISRGKGINITYVYPKGILDILPIPRGLTPGETLTSAIALILAFSYCKAKSGKILRALLGTVFIYIGVLLSALLPFLIRQTAGLFNIEIKAVTPILISRFLLIIIPVELAVTFYLRNKKQFIKDLKNTGFLKTAQFILIFILGMLLYRNHIERLILENASSFLLTIISIGLIWRMAVVCPRSPAASGWLFLLACVSALSVNFATFYFTLLGAGAVFLYYNPPLKLKRIPFFSKIIVSFEMFLLAMLGWLFAGGEILKFPHIFTLYFLVFFTGCINILGLKAPDADKTEGIKTLPVIFGERTSRLLIGSFFLVSFLLIPLLFLEKTLFLPSAAFGLLEFYLIVRKDIHENLILLVYFTGLVSLLTWLNSFRNFI
jgi:hypothetical protein